MASCCVLCLEMKTDPVNVIKTNATKWRELNVAYIIEKYFWRLNNVQSSSWICLTCWQLVEDFHRFYLRIEEAHMKFNVVKVEKEEIMEFNFQEVENKPQEDFIEPKIATNQKYATLDMEIVEDNIVAKVKNSSADYKSISANYGTGSEISDDDNDGDYQLVPDSLGVKRKPPSHSKSKNNDKFIAEHFRKMSCDICQEPLNDFSHMKKHFATKHNQRGYVVCCKRKFSDRFHLVDHLRLHLNPNHFKCNHCGKTMSDRRTMKRHIMFEHFRHVEYKCHQCEACDVSFKEKYLLRIHRSIHLPQDEKEFPCSDCSETYNSFYPLLQHLKVVHLKKFFGTCYVCGKSITCSRDFEAHLNKHEGRPHMIYCNVCGLGLASEKGLRRHQKNQHPADGKKEYPCPSCPKISPTLKAIREHINTVHIASFDHKCEICERVFKRKSALKEHMSAHRGTPLYSCPWCPKMFYANSNMHTHRKHFHPKEWEEAKLQKYSEDFQPIVAKSIS